LRRGENLPGAENGVRLIFLWGLPGTGKLTVAKELSELTGWRLFHNHLTVDLLLAVFPFGSKAFVELREQIWLSVFEAAAASGTHGLIFTFNPENSVRQSFIDEVSALLAKHYGQVEFVEIFCDEAALSQRMDTPQRREHKKLVSMETFRELHRTGVFDSPVMPKAKMRVDTTQHGPREAAVQIVEGLGLPVVL
jgi:adenylylsulfate kinase-like enzyme